MATMTMAALKRRLRADPGRYVVRGWTVGRDYARYSDRPAGEPAYLVVDDCRTQTSYHVRGVPEREAWVKANT